MPALAGWVRSAETGHSCSVACGRWGVGVSVVAVAGAGAVSAVATASRLDPSPNNPIGVSNADSTTSAPQTAYYVTAYWTAGEGTITEDLRSLNGASCKKRKVRERTRQQLDRQHGSRARGEIRRYCVSNLIRYMWTLTYAGLGEYDMGEAKRALGLFLERLARAYPPMPVVAVPEWHPGGHGIHWHVGVPIKVDYRVVNECWRHRDRRGERVGEWIRGEQIGATETPKLKGQNWWNVRPSKVAGYLAKYVAKGAEENMPAHLHRYHVTRGWKPVCQRARVVGLPAARTQLLALAGGVIPRLVWRTPMEDCFSMPDVRSYRWEPYATPDGEPLGRLREARRRRLKTALAHMKGRGNALSR